MPDVLSIQLGGGSVVQKNVSILSVSIIFLAKILISNFRDCWANNIRSCCVRVGSGIQTDARLSTIVGPAVHRGKDTTYKT